MNEQRPFRAGRGERATAASFPTTVGGSSPIKHVIYVLKENRTYDQDLGDLGRGNGDSSLTMFPESVTPNQHALARQFVDPRQLLLRRRSVRRRLDVVDRVVREHLQPEELAARLQHLGPAVRLRWLRRRGRRPGQHRNGRLPWSRSDEVLPLGRLRRQWRELPQLRFLHRRLAGDGARLDAGARGPHRPRTTAAGICRYTDQARIDEWLKEFQRLRQLRPDADRAVRLPAARSHHEHGVQPAHADRDGRRQRPRARPPGRSCIALTLLAGHGDLRRRGRRPGRARSRRAYTAPSLRSSVPTRSSARWTRRSTRPSRYCAPSS